MGQFLIKHPDILLKQSVSDAQWQYRIKKLLFLCIQQLSLQNLSHGIPFRTLETFSSDEIVSRYIIDVHVRRAYLENVYRYLVKRKYFKLVRQLLEEKVPPLYDVVLSPPNSISDTLLQMIQHPLHLLSAGDDLVVSADCATLILSSFVAEILVPEYTAPIQLFILPCLAQRRDFPFFHLLQYLSDLVHNHEMLINNEHQSTNDRLHHPHHHHHHQMTVAGHNINNLNKLFNSSYLFKSILLLDQMCFEQMDKNDNCVRNYIKVLGRLSNNIRKLQHRSKQSIFRQEDYAMEVDPDDDFDSDDEEQRHKETISTVERECLQDVITLLNTPERSHLILDHNDDYLDDVSVLYSLCKICHNLMLYHRAAVFEYRYSVHPPFVVWKRPFDDIFFFVHFRLLYMLTFKPKFIRALWYALHTQQNSGFSSPLNLIAKGIQIRKFNLTIKISD